MRDVAREERADAGPAGGDLVADLEGGPLARRRRQIWSGSKGPFFSEGTTYITGEARTD